MHEDRQKGSDAEWLQHSNDELARMVRARNRRIRWLRFVNFLLLLALAWLVYKFSRKAPLEELWRF
jgi:hypothetical protein